MRVHRSEIVDYKVYHSMTEANYPGVALEVTQRTTWKDWAAAIATGIGAGAVMAFVVGCAAGALIR